MFVSPWLRKMIEYLFSMDYAISSLIAYHSRNDKTTKLFFVCFFLKKDFYRCVFEDLQDFMRELPSI